MEPDKNLTLTPKTSSEGSYIILQWYPPTWEVVAVRDNRADAVTCARGNASKDPDTIFGVASVVQIFQGKKPTEVEVREYQPGSFDDPRFPFTRPVDAK